ncbi:MAG: hypothetical protein ACYDEN_07995, partial [Acidimicrobiales bacterium]
RDGSLYVATGNGSPAGAVDDSDSVLRLSPSLRVQGRFTPADYASLSLHDTDLGSTSPALLPGGLVFIAGKQGIGYVLDGARLGGTGGQLASRRICGGAFGGDATEGDTVMVACFQQLVAVRVTPPGHGRRAGLRVVWTAGVSAGPPIVAGGVVWDVTRADRLMGFRAASGEQVAAIGTAPVGTSFPSLSASGPLLVVPEGNEVVSYTGA